MSIYTYTHIYVTYEASSTRTTDIAHPSTYYMIYSYSQHYRLPRNMVSKHFHQDPISIKHRATNEHSRNRAFDRTSERVTAIENFNEPIWRYVQGKTEFNRIEGTTRGEKKKGKFSTNLLQRSHLVGSISLQLVAASFIGTSRVASNWSTSINLDGSNRNKRRRNAERQAPDRSNHVGYYLCVLQRDLRPVAFSLVSVSTWIHRP